MNAITADTRPAPRRDTRPAARRTRHGTPRDAATGEDRRFRRRTIVAAVAATFLGAYVLGVTWFAETLNADMARSYQLAPAVQDVEHR